MNKLFLFIQLFICLLIVSACKKNTNDAIAYYNKVNEIDSIYRIAKNPQLAVKKYSQLFSEFTPKNQDRIEEYTTYITLADRLNIDFGGKKSLYKMISLLAPYGNTYKIHLSLFKKYGIDNTEVKKQIADWKKQLNKRLIDSFSVAMIRDQEKRHIDLKIQAKNLKKNADLLIWTFKNYGFPSVDKIGTTGNNNVFFAMPTFLTHMIESDKYPYIKHKLLEYVKSGDCPPRDYALMVDMYNDSSGIKTCYSYGLRENKDSAQINRNRKSIGLPSLKHSAKIRKDYFSSFE
ncbi:hypothetical protein [uncultured Chryseobacterium sp.]|uniref:hypothetical protein n=1 Tax=uncultured Chryseobacterium sp. TaxID=259322 RepID=UPI0025D3D04B|nr:hypothetical protein [uncultured Chryseobacterium sp.]